MVVILVVTLNYILWNFTYKEYFGNLTLKIFNFLDFYIGSVLLIAYIRASKTKNKVYKRKYEILNKNNHDV